MTELRVPGLTHQERARRMFEGQSTAGAPMTQEEIEDVKRRLQESGRHSWVYGSEIEEILEFLGSTEPGVFTNQDAMMYGSTPYADEFQTGPKGMNYWQNLQIRMRELENKETISEEENIFIRLVSEAQRRRTGS